MKRILVVDDEPTILSAVATRLRAEAFDVETAVDGPSAVATAAATQPDLVVLDVMPTGWRCAGASRPSGLCRCSC